MGSTGLWLNVKLKLSGDPAAFKAFQEMYGTACSMSKARSWWNENGGVKLLDSLRLCDGNADPPPRGMPKETKYPHFTYDDAGEYELECRHPGDDPAEDEDFGRYQTIATKAAMGVAAIFFGRPGDKDHGDCQSAIRAVYPSQILLRVQGDHSRLIYDVFEARPLPSDQFAWPLTAEETARVEKEFFRIGGDDEDEGEEYSDGYVPDHSDRSSYYLMEAFSYFRNTRLLRCCIGLETITGISLRVQQDGYSPGDYVLYKAKGKDWQKARVLERRPNGTYDIEKEDSTILRGWFPVNLKCDPSRPSTTPKPKRQGLLIIDVSSPPKSFAARVIRSSYDDNFNLFVQTADWTPQSAASSSTRHYIVGDYDELYELCEELCEADYALSAMFQGEEDNSIDKDKLGLEHIPELPDYAFVAPEHRPAPTNWGPVEGLDEPDKPGAGMFVKARHGDAFGGPQDMEDIIKQEIDREDEAIDNMLKDMKDPVFRFPKTPELIDDSFSKYDTMLKESGMGGSAGIADALKLASELGGKGKKGKGSTGYEGRGHRGGSAPTAVSDESFQQFLSMYGKGGSASSSAPEATPEPAPAPVPATQLLPPAPGQMGGWKCGGCSRGGLLPWMKRCPGCGTALSTKAQPAAPSQPSAKSAPKEAKEGSHPVPDSWEDES